MYHLLEGFNESFAKGGLMLFLFNFAIFSKKQFLTLQGSWQERTSSNATRPKGEVNNTAKTRLKQILLYSKGR